MSNQRIAPVLPVLFRDLAVGQTFDFVDDARPEFNSFYGRVVKTSSRMYASVAHPTYRYRVGTINVEVFHVEPAPADDQAVQA